jgi:hypothetical protein
MTVTFIYPGLIDEAELTLHLAKIALEGLIGVERVMLETECHVNKKKHSISIATKTGAGMDLARIFLRLVTCEFGRESYAYDTRG